MSFLRLTPVGNPFQALVEMLDRLDNPSPAIQDEIGDAVRNGFYRSFNWQGSAGGGWSPLAPSTVADRIRRGYPGTRPILVRTGSYLHTFTDRNNPEHVQRFERTGNGWALLVGSDDERAPWHEFGTARMPARPVTLQDIDERRIQDVLDNILARIEAAIRG